MLTGTTEPDALVELSTETLSLGSTTADASGNWIFVVDSPLGEASHHINVSATDVAGNISAAAADNVFVPTSISTTTDNWSKVYLNGDYLGSTNSWGTKYVFDNFTLLDGDNVLAIESYDSGGVAAMTAQLADASGNTVGTSQVDDWKVFIADNNPNAGGYNSNSLIFPEGWNTVEYDSSDSDLWKVPQDVSSYTNPWGNRSGDPVWIWSGDDNSDANNHDAVLFRYEFSTSSSSLNLTIDLLPLISGPSGLAGAATSQTSINEKNTLLVHGMAANEPVVWSLMGGEDQSLFSIDTSTGDLMFISAPDFEDPEDHDGDNVYDVIVAATDSNGNLASQRLSISVLDIPDEISPEFLSDYRGIPVRANSASGFSIYISDVVDESPVTYQLLQSYADDSSEFTIDNDTGHVVLAGIPDFHSANTYTFTIVATDVYGNSSEHQIHGYQVARISFSSMLISVGLISRMLISPIRNCQVLIFQVLI